MINEVEAAREQAEFSAKCAATKAAGQKLLARIRRSSKYFGQGVEDQKFPAVVTNEFSYCVTGRPGRYRLIDVDLFAVFDADADPIQITFE